jgi:hypothetical protein
MVAVCGMKKVHGALPLNAKPLEDTQKGHDVGQIGSNGSGATVMRKRNNFVINQWHVTPRHVGQGGQLGTHTGWRTSAIGEQSLLMNIQPENPYWRADQDHPVPCVCVSKVTWGQDQVKFLPINDDFSMRHTQESVHNKKQPITGLSHGSIPVGHNRITVISTLEEFNRQELGGWERK